MRQAAIIILGGLVIILGGLIALELGAAGAPSRDFVGKSEVQPPVPGPVAGTTTDRGDAWVAAILAKPLFDSTRSPPAALGAVGTRVANGPPRLSGIMITPTEKEAVFTPADGGPIVAAEGGRVGAFTVRSIGPESVIVTGPHGVMILHTSFDNGAKAAALPPSPFSLFNGITGTPGGISLANGKMDLPNPATWSGPPPLTRLPVSQPAPASTPLLTSSRPSE